MKVLDHIRQARKAGKKQFAILVDPDKINPSDIMSMCELADASRVDFFFVGGSLLANDSLGRCVAEIKSHTDIPVVLFPGNTLQIDKQADAILFLSLISGRNPELLIGKQVSAAPLIRQYGLEAIATGYLLIDGGNLTTVQYISNTRPIPREKDDIAAYTALAGEMLGFQCIFMDAGSGADKPVSERMIETVRKHIGLPVIVGGGIRSAETAVAMAKAGADLLVVGNAIEKDTALIPSISAALHAI